MDFNLVSIDALPLISGDLCNITCRLKVYSIANIFIIIFPDGWRSILIEIIKYRSVPRCNS